MLTKNIFIGRFIFLLLFYKWTFQWWDINLDPPTEAAGSSDTGRENPDHPSAVKSKGGAAPGGRGPVGFGG